ncbi:hypothetical protein Y1Q_0013983 [Alligator mississippiensis]|uniref:DDE Tnp4 domain-containing protein n=1 Tax=Alligator mississippiensis TaxID=8496 RepID=A0A151PE86_ALLMI|nr:hypothetical protein Y1Q_0013983 [Alligator mississippiensis]
MTWTIFQDHLEQLQPHLEQQDTNMWLPLPVDTWLALTLFKLATPTSLSGPSLWPGEEHHQRHYPGGVQCPSGPLAVVAGFHALGIPQGIKTLDGTHILVTCLPYSDCPFYSWRGFHSIMLQAVVDYHGTFINVSVNWVGSAHDTHVFQNSTL